MATTKKRTRAEGRAPQPAHEVRLGGPTRKARKKERSPQDQVESMELQRSIYEMLGRRLSVVQIARLLKISKRRVARLSARALDEYYADNTELVHRYLGKNLFSRDLIIQSFIMRARGYRLEDGTVVDPEPEAANVVLRAMRDQDRLLNYGQSIKVEHSGAGGGPIMTAHVDAREAAMKVRESFVDAPMVILAEGESIDDVPQLASRH